MGCQVVRFDHHVIHIDFQVLSKLTLENILHQVLIHGSSVFQPEWHDFVTKVCGFGYEPYFLLVPGVHPYMVVARIDIQKA